MKEIKITEDIYNQRIDKFLLKYFNNASKNFVYKMLRKKNIKLNEKKAKGNEILKVNDILKIYVSDETIDKFQKEKIINNKVGSLDIIYEDKNILIVNKPKGILSHSDSKNKQDTIIDRILFYLKTKSKDTKKDNFYFTPGICNRLDRNTSGIIICGKNIKSLQLLNEQKNFEKYYLTIIKGKFNKKCTFIGYHIKNGNTNEVKIYKEKILNSKQVITECTPIKYNEDFTILKIKLITGRSHQIRAHLQSQGYYILGDKKYGDKNINKWLYENFNIEDQILHAYEIIFNFKDEALSYLNNKKFKAKLPDYFTKLEKNLF